MLSWSYCTDSKRVEGAYIRFELDSKQQLSGIQIPPNKWSYTEDQSGHVVYNFRLLGCLFVTTAESHRLQFNRTSFSVGLAIEFSPPGPCLFYFIEIPGVNFFEE